MTGFIFRAVGLFAAILVFCGQTVASDLTSTDKDGVAIQGYDTVAYFTQNRAVEGKPEYSYTWQDARWFFLSPEHRDMFAKDPQAFAPRYGGYCSGGMALGRKSRSDPTAWKIIDGKLYLAFNHNDIETFVETAGSSIPTADENWKAMQDPD